MGINLNTTSKKLLASGALIATAAAVAGIGTYGAFTDTVTVDAEVETGTVDIRWEDEINHATLPIVAKNLAPGDTVVRSATLQNHSSLDIASLTLEVKTQDQDKLIQSMIWNIETCSKKWTSDVKTGFTCDPAAQYEKLSPEGFMLSDGKWVLPDGVFDRLQSSGREYLKITAKLPTTYAVQEASGTFNLSITAEPIVGQIVDGKPLPTTP